jgi:hypothetical protein
MRSFCLKVLALEEGAVEEQRVSAPLAEVPGLGVDSAQQILAEVGPTAATFPSAGQLRVLGV